MMKLSVLMPVYNEQATLEDILDRVFAAPRPPQVTDVEVVAVDDCSTDRSWDILQRYHQEEPRLKLCRHSVNQGKGAAIRTAIEEAEGDLAVIQDADLEYDPKEYPRLLAPILDNEADVVYGSRFAAAEYRRVLYFWHEVGNKLLTLLSNMLTGLNLTDMETCYKAFRMDVLKTMPIRSNRFGIEPEITAKIAKRRLRIFETPVSYSGRTYLEGKKIGFKDAVQAFLVMLKFHVIDDLYNERYGEATLRNMELATQFSNWLLERLRPYFSGTILEVGSGIGNNVRMLLGHEKVIATEPDPDYVRLLENAFANRRRVEVRQWDSTQPPPADLGPVDTILCSNVLEHIPDEHAALENMRKLLRDSGQIVFVLPRGANLYGTLDKALEHCRRYDEASFRERLAGVGLEVTTSFTVNKPSVPAWFVNGRIFKRKVVGRLQLKVFDMFVPLIRLIDPFLPWRGLSLIVIARPAGKP